MIILGKHLLVFALLLSESLSFKSREFCLHCFVSTTVTISCFLFEVHLHSCCSFGSLFQLQTIILLAYIWLHSSVHCFFSFPFFPAMILVFCLSDSPGKMLSYLSVCLMILFMFKVCSLRCNSSNYKDLSSY